MNRFEKEVIHSIENVRALEIPPGFLKKTKTLN